MEQTDVLVIGGGASGLQSAITSKNNHPDKRVVLVRQEEVALVPCGIPYMFGTLDASDMNRMPDELLTKPGVEIKIGAVAEVNIENKSARLEDGTEYTWDKVIFATGSTPIIPSWLKGADLENVFTIPKNKVYLDAMLDSLKSSKRVIVVGAGFIGVETSDELNKRDFDVTLVELEPEILSKAFDPEFCEIAEKLLEDRGVHVKTGVGIKEIHGCDGAVATVELSDGSMVDADAVVLSMGYKPNTELAVKAGIEVNQFGFIKTCEYMRVHGCSADAFAVGDCAEKRDFISYTINTTMLASTACAEARIAGMNLYEISPCKAFNGTIAIYHTVIGDEAFGTAGVTETAALKAHFDIVAASFTGMDRHPGKLPGMKKQTVKLIVAADCGVIIGGEVHGGTSIGELTNNIGFLIQNRTSIKSLLGAQIGTQPMLTGSPAGYPLIKAAEVAEREIKKRRQCV